MPPNEIPGLEGARLTPRETEVIHLILARHTNLAISLHLACSVKNVEAHISSIFRKTHTNSRLDLVMKIMSAAREASGGGGTAPTG
ncbi:MAG TPA: helix-turn-helix transcriptional regulator [Polyangiaceae bacterium]|nr:helix-turn-helix transcriptional regulator [Polyangiaceae bacterium]